MFIRSGDRYNTKGRELSRYIDISPKMINGKHMSSIQQATHLKYLAKHDPKRSIQFSLDSINPYAIFYSDKGYGKKVLLPSGLYNYVPPGYSDPAYLKINKVRDTEENYFIEDQYNDTLTYINNFLNNKEYYDTQKISYKMGLLLYGPPGNGKTSFIRYLSKKLFTDAIIIHANTVIDNQTLSELKKEDKLKVIIMEELTDGQFARSTGELLRMLDGEETIDNAIYIATTNYPENLPANIVDRPGRFDKIVKIGNPSKKAKEDMLLNYFNIEKSSVEYLINNTEDMSIAQLKEVTLLHKIHNLEYADAIQKMKDHSEFVKSEFAELKASMGIF